MNKFELFTMIFFSLDAYYAEDMPDDVRDFLSSMCPFTFEDIDSADSAIYDEFCDFIGDREITLENSYKLAEKYIKQLDYADVTAAFDEVLKKNWINACKRYLSHPHKGAGDGAQ